MSSPIPPVPPKPWILLPMVESVGGKPVVQWRRVGLTVLCAASSMSLGPAICSWFGLFPFRPLLWVCPFSGALLGFLSLVELQRQVILNGGKPRLQFSLAGMLVATTIIACGLGAMMYEINADKARFKANRELKARLDEIIGEGEAYTNDEIFLEVKRTSFSNDDLAKIIAEVKAVRGERCRFSHLFLSGTAVTDDGLAFLSEQTTSLVVLSLSNTSISDQTVQRLTNCPKLIVLDFTRTKVTAGSLPTIQNLRSLKAISVGGTPLSLDPSTPTVLPGTYFRLK